MTGVAGGTGGGDAGPAQDSQQGESQSNGQDLSQITSLLESQGSSQQELLDSLKNAPWNQPAEPEPMPDLSEFLNVESPDFDPNAMAAQINQTVERLVNERLQAQVAPIQSEWAEHRTQLEAQALVGQYPEMAKAEVYNAVIPAAKELAESLGMPELANKPQFWGVVYAASTAQQQAQQEGTESSTAAFLEGGGGAGPATGNEANPAAGFGGPRPSSPLPFP